jgi:hypothetical protein
MRVKEAGGGRHGAARGALAHSTAAAISGVGSSFRANTAGGGSRGTAAGVATRSTPSGCAAGGAGWLTPRRREAAEDGISYGWGGFGWAVGQYGGGGKWPNGKMEWVRKSK